MTTEYHISDEHSVDDNLTSFTVVLQKLDATLSAELSGHLDGWSLGEGTSTEAVWDALFALASA